ncbi:MAG: efflux RND transporter permease subunit [Planctomycetota bacterium]|jgi:Cu(I)/Ag(I) efflux system membrane protein CusA/SilA
MNETLNKQDKQNRGLLAGALAFCLSNRLVVLLFVIAVVLTGIAVAPFDWDINWLTRSPVPVDAIPDIGENQQIVFTEWPGRSPQDIQDQITYPLTVSLLGIPKVKTIRSNSMFGFSSIYIIFEDDADWDQSRNKIIERLNSLSSDTLPEGVRPALGPDATALGQVFWYTLEGYDAEGDPTGGWDLHELRTVQDWTVRDALMSAGGVAEVASVGGFVREYQIDVDPDAMHAANVGLNDVFGAIKASNRDVGARTIEVNQVEYVVRGIGFIKSIADIEQVVVKVNDNVPIRVKDISHVSTGPALRRGVLDKEGAEAVGGVVVVRYGENPLEVIQNVKAKINEIAPGLPRKTLADGSVSQVKIIPFYDRTGLIYETLGTLNDAIAQEILITIIVIIILLRHFRSSVLISGLLPLAVLMCFIAMRFFKIDANIVALSGIAIAIGTMVDMGIVICENIVRHLQEAPAEKSRLQIIYDATCEVGSAVLAAISTTIVSFLPVFTMIGAEGKLFRPLAFTKTFALLASALIAIFVIPVFAYWFYHGKQKPQADTKPKSKRFANLADLIVVLLVSAVLSKYWMPLGPDRGVILSFLFVAAVLLLVLVSVMLLTRFYPPMLNWCLAHKGPFLMVPLVLVIAGGFAWRSLGKEFMPSLDEGSFLYMPTTMPHASIGEAVDVLAKIDSAIKTVPEVKTVVGKIGRVESPLDPAPISMVETVIDYHSKFKRDKDGRIITDDNGKAIRQWRDHIESPRDIWDEIVKAAKLPGTTSAPLLQPIETRLIMLQTGMRAPMGIKVKGPDLQTIETVGLQLEQLLKEMPFIDPGTVFAERIVAKPYIEIHIDREAIARYGLRIDDVQNVIEIAIGGKPVTKTVEGRQRYPVRVRYLRELRNEIQEINEILVPAPGGVQIPMGQLVRIEYTRGPQVIKSEDTFLTGYVLFDGHEGLAEVDVVEDCSRLLNDKIAAGELVLPAGVSYSFAGTYENQIRAQKTLKMVLPVALGVIFLILYFQFKTIPHTLLVFSGIFVAWSGGFLFVAWSGGFLLLWLYGQGWFMNVSLLGVNLRQLFNIHTYNLSVAVWVGFLALFGIATDDGVLMMTYLTQQFKKTPPEGIDEIRAATITAAHRRVRPALMTSATTILALLPILTSTGRGADIMVPMAIPSFGGMILAVIVIFIVPVLFCWMQERKIKQVSG